MKIFKILKLINIINENREKLKEVETLLTNNPQDKTVMFQAIELNSDYILYTEDLYSNLGFSIDQDIMNSKDFLKDINEINDVYLNLINMIDCYDAYDYPTCAPNFQKKLSSRIEKLSENIIKKYSNK